MAGWMVLVLLVIGAASPADTERLTDPLVLARLIPVRWQELHLLAEKEYGRRQIAHLQISYARADYVSSDHSCEAEFEVIDTLHSPMHYNEFEFDRSNAPADRITVLDLSYGTGYLVQDFAEEQTRIRLLFKNRYLVKIQQSPQVDAVIMHRAITAWLTLPDVHGTFK
ncbi:MAG TPA: hypothetical protein PLN26_02530 [Acidobacteriota bacterium]|nr:hypothetical protein [Acidobacteriota bacterium]